MGQPGGGEEEEGAFGGEDVCAEGRCGCGAAEEVVGVEVHADGVGGGVRCSLGERVIVVGNGAFKGEVEVGGGEAGGRFLRPDLVGVVEVRFSVVGHDLPPRVDGHGGVVGD